MTAKHRPLIDIGICIPVRDEADELPGLFGALEALDAGRNRITHVCLLLDGCTDGSAALVESYRRTSRHRVVIRDVAAADPSAGRARRLALELGLHAVNSGRGLLLTTDADSRPAADWVCRMQDALTYAPIVVGRIVRQQDVGASPLQDRIERYYDALLALRRRLDPVPWECGQTHHFTGGANMGFRADAYRALGGFKPLVTGEDARLVDDAGRAGFGVRRDARCIVVTSARRTGRAEGGLAGALRRCDVADAHSTIVAHPHDAAWQYRLHALARAAFPESGWLPVAQALGLSRDHVLGVARDCPNGEAFAMRIVPAPPNGMRSVTLAQAEVALAGVDGERRAA